MISAKIVADSIANDIRLTTLQLKYPRFIHSEFMTHRMFSRNASSSRAIPVAIQMGRVEEEPAMPEYWGSNKPGMQAGEELPNTHRLQQAWGLVAGVMVGAAEEFASKGVHKQIVNRLLEPFSHIEVVCTATEWENFFNLRAHPAAQPEIRILAERMRDSMGASKPEPLGVGGWHMPYLTDRDRGELSEEDQRKVSVARCARVSYLNHDKSHPEAEKDIALHDRLFEAKHMSPFEHVAIPMGRLKSDDWLCQGWGDGVTHVDQDGSRWSGNFREWVQYRQLL